MSFDRLAGRLMRPLIGAFCLCLPLADAAAQQFVDETATRFPQPDPDDYTNQITIGDLDGDGDLDLIFANGADFNTPDPIERQRVYINDGSAVFTDETQDRLNFGGRARGVELGDIDDDGDLDVIFAQDFNAQPKLFVNDGSGFFTDVTAAQLPAMTLSSSRAQFGDIDNDGDLDLYITNGGATNRFGCGQYQVWVNDGSGFFTDETALRHPIGNVCSNMDCIFGDVDNDFDLDVKTASTGFNNSRLYINDGTGVFTLDATVPSDSSCYSYDFGDMDGDGDLDLLGANGGSNNAEILLENDGSGGFTNVSSQLSPNSTSQDDNDSKFFDYDVDGDLDLIIGRIFGPEKVYTNDGNGNFTLTAGVIESNTDSTLDIMVADLDNDGDLDVVTAQGESLDYCNRIYINQTGPADTIAPRVIQTEQLPDTDDGAGPFVVRALVLDDMTSDRNFFDKGITLNYSVGAGPLREAPMRHSGGQVYRGEIPGQPAGSEVSYFVTARDWADNVGTGDTLSFQIGGVFGDLDGDGVVGTPDLLMLLAAWGPCPDPCPPSCPADLDADCLVGVTDFLALLANWG